MLRPEAWILTPTVHVLTLRPTSTAWQSTYLMLQANLIDESRSQEIMMTLEIQCLMCRCLITSICDTHPALTFITCMLLPVIADSAAAFLRICPPPSNMLPGTSITSIRH